MRREADVPVRTRSEAAGGSVSKRPDLWLFDNLEDFGFVKNCRVTDGLGVAVAFGRSSADEVSEGCAQWIAGGCCCGRAAKLRR